MKAQSNSKSGYRNIFYNDAKRFYTVHICRNGRRFIVYTDTKEEAIEVRNKALTFYEEHGQLPKKSDLGLKQRRRKIHMKAQSNSKSGHKNISYIEEKRSYVVSIRRNGRRFIAHANTKEEAIDIRNKALDFFEEHSCFPKKSDLGLTRRNYRRFAERVKKVRRDCVCQICKRVMSYRTLSKVKEFEERGNVCGNCLPKDRSEVSLKIKPNKPNRLNEKYISSSIDKYGRVRYSVNMEKRRCSINRSFKSLDDAIRYRNQILKFFNERDRMPDDKELASFFGKKSYNRSISNEPSESDNSATGLKNIAYNKIRDVYQVSITRNRVKTALSFKTLEEAKLARKIILETFDKTGVMLRSGEVRAKMKELKIKGDH